MKKMSLIIASENPTLLSDDDLIRETEQCKKKLEDLFYDTQMTRHRLYEMQKEMLRRGIIEEVAL